MFNALLAVIALAISTFATGVTSPAEAKIRCANGFQILKNGSRLATPYCQDDLLARVAREYGHRVSSAKIRSNPNTKRYVCRFVGQDIRVQQTCKTNNYDMRSF